MDTGRKKIFRIFATGLLIVFSFSFYFDIASAQIPVTDVKTGTERWLIFFNEKTERQVKEGLDKAAAIAFKSSLHYLLNTFAYDAAVWIASGGKDGGPMFFGDNWGDYLKNVADGAAGNFLQQMGKNWLGFNVCEPDFNVKLSIGLALQERTRPKTPDCTITKLAKNWNNFVNDPNFIDRFEVKFKPEQNDILIGLGMFQRYNEYTATEIANATKDREEGQGMKSVTSKISDRILTPAKLSSVEAEQAIEKGNFTAEAVQTGDIVADAINTFTSTLGGKILKKMIQKGITAFTGLQSSSSNVFEGNNQTSNDLYSSDGTQPLFSRETAQVRFLDFKTAGLITSGPYELLQKLSSCDDQTNAGPEDCVIDQKFRLAIESEMTVKEAIAKGYLAGDAPFGFTSPGYQPNYNQGYPYRSLLILRAHRIIPTTWEVAAEIINKGLAERKTYGLNDLIAAYDVAPTSDKPNPFYHLIDQNWVLKAPEHFCKAEGYGPIVTAEDLVDGTTIRTRDTYCADYQSCIDKSNGGSCVYGYCTEERRVWNLGEGGDCPSYYNTCQTFTDRAGNAASYLQNTLSYSSCNADNVGCQWYCQAYNTVDRTWTCVNDGKKVLKSCVTPGGCFLSTSCVIPQGGTTCLDEAKGINLALSSPCASGLKWYNNSTGQCDVSSSCTVAQGGIQCTATGCEALPNFLLNSGFESKSQDVSRPVANWAGDATYFQQVTGTYEQIYSGKNSIRFYSAGQGVNKTLISDGINLSAGKTYTFSGFIYNNLNLGNIGISVNGVTKNSLLQRGWEEISLDFTGQQNTTVVINISGVQVSGSAWFDNFRISEVCSPQTVVLSLAGNTDRSQSKIHFDRDVNECQAQADGCSRFFSAPEGISYERNLSLGSKTYKVNGYNFIPDAGFESGDFNSIWSMYDNVNVELETTDVHSGAGALKLKKGGAQSNINVAFEADPTSGRTFLFSFWAKASISQPGPILSVNGRANYISPVNLSYGQYIDPAFVDMNKSITDKAGLNNTWKQFAVPIHFGSAANNKIVISLWPLSNGNEYIIYDDLQLQEIDFRRASPTILNNTTRDQCIGLNKQNQFTIWADNLCFELDIAALLNRDTIYLRKAPDYLSCHGYTTERPSPYVLDKVTQDRCVGGNLVWRPDSCSGGYCCHETDPAECFNYAMYCQQDEVGCESYSSASGSPAVPAVVAYDDYCPAECVGYNTFKQSPTYFESDESLSYFIPSTGRQCTASDVGCDEFTNLDEVAKGGEGREYYSYLRLCEKQSDGANCSNFYTWQGSDESGYQLKVYSIVANADTSPKDAVASRKEDKWANWPSYWCNNKEDLNNDNLPDCCDGPEDIANNSFCKQLYAATGEVFYRIYANTVSCDENCLPYRRTIATTDQTLCENSGGRWENNTACIHYAIPSQGVSCSAAVAGCREYRGNAGANVYTAFSSNFESGSSAGWSSGTLSSEALSFGGHSLLATNSAETFAASLPTGICSQDTLPACGSGYPCYDAQTGTCLVESGGQICHAAIGSTGCGTLADVILPAKNYLLTFWAKSGTGTTVNANVYLNRYDSKLFDLATLTTAANPSALKTVKIGSEWQYYQFGLFVLEKDKINQMMQLVVEGTNGRLYLDNIEFKQVYSYTYVVKNSWKTPASCDTNPYVNPPDTGATRYMLGCQQYRDSSSQIHNLKSFNHLCRQSAVGCQSLVDTRNTASPYASEFNVGDQIGYLSVPADNITYLVNLPEFNCDAANKGCQRLGVPVINQNNAVASYNDIYLLNDPDKYSTSLCANPEVGCDEFQSSSGYSYFKAPGDRTCEYKQIPEKTGEYGWFKTGTAAKDPDCPVVYSPLGVVHPNPAQNWTGLCTTQYSGCTEFVEPISSISTNVVLNSKFNIDADQNDKPDYWQQDGQTLYQVLDLRPATPYTLSFTRSQNSGSTLASVELKILDCPGVTSFDSSMEKISDSALRVPVNSYRGDNRANLPGARQYSARFFVPENLPPGSLCRLVISDSTTSLILQDIQEVSVGRTGVYYSLDSSVDKTSCNGVVDPINNNCVLFNNRSGINYKLSEADSTYLNFDADVSGPGVNSSVPVSSCIGACDSNVILKVKPDRTCNQWLDCKTKIKNRGVDGKEREYCIEIASCDRLDAHGNCTHYLNFDEQRVNNANVNICASSGDCKSQLISSLTAQSSNADSIANMSGYSKAGITVNDFSVNDTVYGLYSYDFMTQVGQPVFLSNGDFESIGSNNYPLGWAAASTVRAGFQVIKDGKSATQEGINVLGGGSLKVEPKTIVESEPLAVDPNTTYIISAGLNTKNLHPSGAFAVIDVVGFDENGEKSLFDLKPNTLYGVNIEQAAGSLPEWQSHTVYFQTADYKNIKVKLKNRLSLSAGINVEIGGASYFDNIQILPVLKIGDTYDKNSTSVYTKAKELEPVFAARSCRLYPKIDSPSCNYLDAKGSRYDGLSGYCLLTDPNNQDVCLQWYPVDLIQGDLFGSVPTYTGRFPLYYCLQASPSAGLGIKVRQDLLVATPESTPAKKVVKIYDANDLEKSVRVKNIDRVCLVPRSGENFFSHNSGSNQNAWFVGKPWTCDSPGDCWYKVATTCKNTGQICTQVPLTPCDTDPSNICGYWDDGNGKQYCVRLKTQTACTDNNGDGLADNGECGAQAECKAVANDGFCISNTKPFRMASVSQNGFDVSLQFDETNSFSGYKVETWDDDGNTSDFYFDEIYFNTYQCNYLVQAVSSAGASVPWTSRIQAGSTYIVPNLQYQYNNDATKNNYPPFGAVVAPDPDYDPVAWAEPVSYQDPDTSLQAPYQPRAGMPYSCVDNEAVGNKCSSEFFKLPAALEIPSNLSSAIEILKRLFVRSYGLWQWDKDSRQYVPYQNSDYLTWDMPEKPCPDNFRPKVLCAYADGTKYKDSNNNEVPCLNSSYCVAIGAGTRCLQYMNYSEIGANFAEASLPLPDYCAVYPTVKNVRVNKQENASVSISSLTGMGLVDLSFNVDVDQEQLPLKSYIIAWGDKEEYRNIHISGVDLLDRLSADSPFSISHRYSYYELLERDVIRPSDDIYCFGDTGIPASLQLQKNQCAVKPRIQVIDSWGWCNGVDSSGQPTGFSSRDPIAGQTCSSDNEKAWTSYPGWIIVGLNY